MDFVNDVDLVATAGGKDVCVGSQFPDFINAAIARTVNFQHVHIASSRDLLAEVAGVAGLFGGAVQAVERLGEDPGC